MVTGSRVTEEALSTRNRIWALLAVSLLGFRSWSSRMALRPMGVAALSRPSTLAAMFMVMEPRAGCPLGTSGNRRANRGASQRPRAARKPACSPIFITPSHRHMTPVSPRATSKAVFAESKAAFITAANTVGSPPRYCSTAAPKATRKKPIQRAFSMIRTRSHAAQPEQPQHSGCGRRLGGAFGVYPRHRPGWAFSLGMPVVPARATQTNIVRFWSRSGLIAEPPGIDEQHAARPVGQVARCGSGWGGFSTPAVLHVGADSFSTRR
jgi:hypothetical protein